MGVELGTEYLAVGMVEVLLVQLKREWKQVLDTLNRV